MSKKNNTKTNENAITFTIEKHIADIRKSEAENGWTRELNIVKWADRDACFDLRDWNKDHTKMSKGISLTEKELEALGKAITKALKKPAPRRASAAR